MSDPEAAETEPGRRRPGTYWLQVGLLAALYYGAGKLGLRAGALTGNVTPVWPPTGLALAAIVLFGRRLWPGVLLGALLVNGMSPVPLWVACGMAVGNTLEAVVGAALVERWGGAGPTAGRVKDVVSFTVLAAVAATLISASVGVASLRAGGVIPPAALWSTWRVWWVGDALGALVVAPAVLAWARVRRGDVSGRDWIEAGVLGVALVGVTAGVFSGHFDHPYAVFPLLSWAALRFRHPGAATATLLIASVAVVSTADGLGPFASGGVTSNLWVLDTFLAVVALTGMLLASVVTERDRAMGEARRLSGQLAARVSELQLANKELEAFTYTVSHDLRAPLRNIDGFSRMLVKRLDASLDPDAHHYLEVVRRNAKAMGTLIDELLAFSRLQRQELRTQPVDVAAVVDEALALHDSERAGRDVEIVVGTLPAAVADRALLTQVYSNLIGNALKFTRGRAPARVELGAAVGDDGEAPVFFVRDNGVGFDMAYADKLFGVFQRLHRFEDFEGSGVGLAIVARIVTRHGGRVWAEGRPDAGATVFFTLRGATC